MTETGTNSNRWGIAAAGFLMQMALGAVYAWSVFRVPLAKRFHWSIEEVTLTFTISIFVLGVAAFFGGLWLNRKGPRVVALTGGFLYGLGVFLASFSANKLWWLYLSYGLIGGIGVGFGYIVPIAVLVKWFPDRRGLITGIAVGGFWRRGFDLRTFGYSPDSKCWRLADIRLSWHRISCDYHGGRLLHAEPSGWVEAGGLGSDRRRDQTACSNGPHSRRRAEDLAVVGAVAAAVPEYFGGHLGNLSRIAHVSGDCQGQRDCGRGNGWHCQHWQCRGPNLLGLDLRCNYQAVDIRGDVPDSGRSLLDAAKHVFGGDSYSPLLHRPYVLRRRVRHHASLYCRLFRIEERWAHLWSYADGVGFRERLWAFADRAYATKQRFVYKRSPRDRRHHGGIDDFAHPCFAAQIHLGREHKFEARGPCNEFQMNSLERTETSAGQGPADCRSIKRPRETDRMALAEVKLGAHFLAAMLSLRHRLFQFLGDRAKTTAIQMQVAHILTHKDVVAAITFTPRG